MDSSVIVKQAHLVETVLATVRDVDNLDDLGGQPGIEEVRAAEVGLELGATGQDKTLNVDLVVGDEVLDRQLGNLSDVVASRLLSKTRETQRRLTTSTVLLRQVDAELVDDFSGVAGQGAEEGAITIPAKVSASSTGESGNPAYMMMKPHLASVSSSSSRASTWNRESQR